LNKSNIKIVVPSSLENLSLIRAMVRTYLGHYDIPEIEIRNFIIIVDELSTNAIEHGYDYKIGEISIDICKLGNEVTIEVEDFGKGYDSNRKSKDEGGMGLQLVKGLVDSFELEKKPTGTEVKIKRVIKGEK